ncbi:hypothetical protein BGW80DRAFT_723791 [Lactifluus volemus]|nr:hypothetical protein BGW80DRAFT_723791 [Lactifluus volemus]
MLTCGLHNANVDRQHRAQYLRKCGRGIGDHEAWRLGKHVKDGSERDGHGIPRTFVREVRDQVGGYSLAEPSAVETIVRHEGRAAHGLQPCNDVRNFYQATLKPMFSLNALTLRINHHRLRRSLSTAIVQLGPNHRIFPKRLDVAGCYLILAYTGCRPAEVVDGENKLPSNGCWNELFSSQATLPLTAPPEDAPPDEYSKDIMRPLEFETQSRGRPKAPCYEDIQLMVIRHPETGVDALTSLLTARALTIDTKADHFLFHAHQKGDLLSRHPHRQHCSPRRCLRIQNPDQRRRRLRSSQQSFTHVHPPPMEGLVEEARVPSLRRQSPPPLPYRTLHDYMGGQSLDMGYEKPIGPKDWRRNVGNTVNGQASDAVRDQVMRQSTTPMSSRMPISTPMFSSTCRTPC